MIPDKTTGGASTVRAFNRFFRRSYEEMPDLLGELSEEEQQRLLKAMQTITSVLEKHQGLKYAAPFVIRRPEPGDMGWVVHLHGALYKQEYGLDEHFEAMTAQIVADFINQFNPDKERCWIAEMGGKIVGSLFLVRVDGETARLRLLLVMPCARGLGLGTRLLEEGIRFARRCGYKKLVLWTDSCLVEARHIYQKIGFKLVKQEHHHSFGKDLIGETWELII